MASPLEAIAKLRETNLGQSTHWTLMAYYLNLDLVNMEAPDRLFGVVIPCGQYPSKELAEKAQTEISVRTGITNLVYCCNNRAFPLDIVPSKDTIVYPHDVASSVEEITQSLERERQRVKKVQQRVAEEVTEREDINSMSYFINKIYRLTTCESKMEMHQKLLLEAEQARKVNYDLVVEYVAKHPTILGEWKKEARERLLERGEIELYAKLESKMDVIQEQIIRDGTGEVGRAIVSPEEPVAANQLKHKFKAPGQSSPVPPV